jgi:heterotetrameric sarcosine oxidase gamma subunit
MIRIINGSGTDRARRKMNDKQRIEKTASALLQAGVEATTFECRTLTLEEVTNMSITRLRSTGNPADLTHETGRCAGNDPTLLCLRPGEWLSVSESLSPGELVARMTAETGDECTTIHDCSHGLAVFRLRGKGSPWLLGKLSGLDYLAGVKTGAHCARTRMGHIGVLVHYREFDEGTFGFDLILDRSYARYFWELLTESAAHADNLAIAYGDAA